VFGKNCIFLKKKEVFVQWKEAANKFLTYIEKQRDYSINTADSYNSDLQQFFQVLELEPNVEIGTVFTKRNIRKFIYFLSDLGQKPKTIARKRSCLLSFGNYLMKEELITSNPARLISVPKVEKNIPALASESQMSELDENYNSPENKTKLRDMLIVELIYGSGILVSELKNLKKRGIDFSNSTIRVVGKGDKERIVPITDVACDLLKDFLSENKKGDFVFPRTAKSGRRQTKNYSNLSGKRARIHKEDAQLLSVRRIRQIVNRELAAVSAAKKRSPHILRHSFASHLLDRGADIRVVKEMLGHSSLASTQVYTHVNIEKMLKFYKQAHPRSGE
jgi:integrase/recombinase XerC